MADREMSLPFGLDSQGRIASTTDPDRIARQHLVSYLLTRPRERVIRADFGTPIREYAFENIDPLQITLMNERVGNRVRRDVRGLTLRTIATTEDSAQASVVLNVEFAVAVGAGDGVPQSTTLTLGGGQ